MWKEERKWLPQPDFLLLSSLTLWQQDKTCYKAVPDVLHHSYREKGHWANYFFPFVVVMNLLAQGTFQLSWQRICKWGGAGAGETASIRTSISTQLPRRCDKAELREKVSPWGWCTYYRALPSMEYTSLWASGSLWTGRWHVSFGIQIETEAEEEECLGLGQYEKST